MKSAAVFKVRASNRTGSPGPGSSAWLSSDITPARRLCAKAGPEFCLFLRRVAKEPEARSCLQQLLWARKNESSFFLFRNLKRACGKKQNSRTGKHTGRVCLGLPKGVDLAIKSQPSLSAAMGVPCEDYRSFHAPNLWITAGIASFPPRRSGFGVQGLNNDVNNVAGMCARVT